MVTKQNIKRISSAIEKDLKKELSCFKGSNGNEFAYKIIKRSFDTFVELYIISTCKKYPFVTMAAISSINEVWQSSKWKDSMYYGADIYIDGVVYPSIVLRIAVDDEQKG